MELRIGRLQTSRDVSKIWRDISGVIHLTTIVQYSLNVTRTSLNMARSGSYATDRMSSILPLCCHDIFSAKYQNLFSMVITYQLRDKTPSKLAV